MYNSKHSSIERMICVNEEFKILKSEFERIRNMGYVKSSRKGTTGIGKTFEDLLGKEEDSYDIPDFLGIEIKTRRSYSKSYITLFSCAPKGETNFEAKRLRDKYGYPDRIYKDFKVLSAIAYGSRPEVVANRYLFKLEVDYTERKVYLVISDRFFNDYEKITYWPFELLKEKLERKLTKLAVVKAWPNRKDGVDYYKYYAINFYNLTSFEQFIKLIEKGVIRVCFKIGIYRDKEHLGEIQDRGTGFQIQESDLDKLYNKVKI